MRLTGLGLYTFPQAAKLLRVSSADLRRWLLGYRSGAPGEVKTFPPLWTPDLKALGLNGLSFHDLLEIRFVQHFRQLGISLQTIRVVAENARRIFGSDHPFISSQFRTDGRTIFADAIASSGDVELIDLKRRQQVIDDVIRPSLLQGIEYQNDQAVRWYAEGRSKAIVLDPQVAFGKPVITRHSIRTDVLHDAWLAENKDTRRVAAVYEVPVSAVKAAIRFELRLAA